MTSLKGRLMGVTVATPGSAVRRFMTRSLRGPTSPTTPMTTRSMPRLSCGVRPSARMWLRTLVDLFLGRADRHRDQHRSAPPWIVSGRCGRSLCPFELGRVRYAAGHEHLHPGQGRRPRLEPVHRLATDAPGGRRCRPPWLRLAVDLGPPLSHRRRPRRAVPRGLHGAGRRGASSPTGLRWACWSAPTRSATRGWWSR